MQDENYSFNTTPLMTRVQSLQEVRNHAYMCADLLQG